MGGHRNLEFGFWANEQSFGSGVLLFLGGLIGTIPYTGFEGTLKFYGYFWAGIYSMIVGVCVMLIEYPRGKRKKGSIVERKFQSPFAKLVTALGPLTRNYYSRFIIYFMLSVPSCTLITTLLGGVGLAIGSLIYLVSAIKGEEWRSPASDRAKPAQGTTPAKYVSEAPKNPPPRRPVNQDTNDLNTE